MVTVRVSKIDNNLLRRTCIVLGYLPLVVLGAVMSIGMGLLWFAEAQRDLARDAREVWSHPEE